jgi:hypothetical protein
MVNTRYNAEAEIEKCRSIIKQYKTCLKNENERLQDVYDTCKLLMVSFKKPSCIFILYDEIIF